MKIYLIKREDDVGYDEYAGFVVAALTPRAAKKLVLEELEHAAYKRGEAAVWSKLPVEHLGQAKPNTTAGIILYDFNAG